MQIKKKVKKIYKSFVFSLSANNSMLFSGYYKYFYKPKEGSLAEVIDLFSKIIGNVSFIQVGANDGFDHDPIHAFIKRDKWKGILLEPQKHIYETYLKKLHAKTKDIFTVNAALDKNDTERQMHRISFSNARWATGLTSFNRSVIEKEIQSGYVARMARKENIEVPADKNAFIISETVRCISPETLLSAHRIDSLDLLQIDTEGFDFEVIKMFEIDRRKPKMIIFEHKHLKQEDFNACMHLLQGNNYLVKQYGMNAVAVDEGLKKSENFKSLFQLLERSGHTATIK